MRKDRQQFASPILTFLALPKSRQILLLFQKIDCKAKLKKALDKGTERLSVPPGE
jgi:hypothetical protein